MALLPPFSSKPHPDSLVHERRLQEQLIPIGKDQQFANVGFAVADLFNGASGYAAWRPDKPRFSGSVLKVAAMFAAFQLRENVRQAAKGLKKGEIFNRIRKEWTPLVERSVAGPKNFPQLAGIFTPSDGDVAFTRDFESDLEAMVTYSDPKASSRLIPKLGHQYINGALAKEGLYSSKDKGMWLGANYAQIEWQSEAESKSHMAATPVALLRFLALLNFGELVSPEASDDMKLLMRNFWMPGILTPPPISRPILPDTSFGKLGWEDVKRGAGKVRLNFDAGVIHRIVRHGNFRYAMVILGAEWDVLERLGLILDDLIVNWH